MKPPLTMRITHRIGGAKMKFDNIRYLIKEGFRSLWVNRMMTLASIGVLISGLLLLGGSTLFVANLNKAFNWLSNQNQVTIFMQVDISQENIDKAKTTIENNDNIIKTEYISPEEAMKRVFDETAQGKIFQEYAQGSETFLPASFIVTIEDLNLYDSTLKQLRDISHVDVVNDQRDIADALVKARNLITQISFWVVILLVAISMFIISNTIKLTMHVRRLEITIMKSVGATNSFITIPFLVEGILIGIFAAIFGFFLVWGAYTYASDKIVSIIQTQVIPFKDVAMDIILGFTGVGALIGFIGSAMSIRKYLKETGGGVYDAI